MQGICGTQDQEEESMLRTENMQEDKVISALECLRLSAEEMELAEKYLSGEAS